MWGEVGDHFTVISSLYLSTQLPHIKTLNITRYAMWSDVNDSLESAVLQYYANQCHC